MDKTSFDHNEIRQWAEKHNGTPQIIDHETAQGDKVGIRINFPGHNDEELLSVDVKPHDISWDEFFQIFDERGLALEYTDKIPEYDPNDSYRFLRREE